jgi:hypothetical protein
MGHIRVPRTTPRYGVSFSKLGDEPPCMVSLGFARREEVETHQRFNNSRHSRISCYTTELP